MAQNMPQDNRMPELQLRQELRSRFPEINGVTVMKVMKMYNNDTEKCFQHLERESQKSLFASPPDTNNHPQSANHNNNFNHSPGNNILHRENPQQQQHHQQPSSSGVGNFSSISETRMPRYQEVPVKHETMHHISTVQHMVGPPPPPSLPPKPLPPKSDVGPPPPLSSFVHSSQVGLPQPHPRLLIDPVNQGSPYPHTVPVAPQDFAPFLESSPRKPTDIPNIRCGPTSFGGGSSTVGGSTSGSSTGVKPVRVISVRGFSGGTVTSGNVVSPTAAFSNPRFSVLHGNGGGTCSMPVSSASVIAPAQSSSARFSGQAYVEPQQWAQETEQLGLHSSSIYIDPGMSHRRTNIQESDPSTSSLHAHQYSYKTAAQYPESTRLSSVPPPRSQALTVSLSSHATSQGLPERSQPPQNVTSVAGFTYSGGYNPAYISPAPQSSMLPNNSGFMVGGGNRFMQEGASPSPSRSVTVAMNQLTIVPGGGSVGSSQPSNQNPQPPVASSTSPAVLIGARMSPVLPPRSPSLQHQRSTGSSTSRSNSMDSEHDPSSVEPPPLPPPHSSPLAVHHGPVHPLQHHHHHHHRGIVGMGVGHGGLVGVSPASSQSSLSSESSGARDREVTYQRQRSGSMQEEAAYSQALLHHQQQRMDKLTEDIESKRQLLGRLREEVSEAEKSKLENKSLRTTFPTAEDIASLCESNRRLQTDIQMYLNEIDMYKNGQTPFSVIDPMGQQNFFNNMPTGPNDLFVRQQNQHNHQQQQQQQPQRQHHRHRSPPPPPPPRPPPMRPPPPQPPMRINSDDLTQTVPPPAPGHTEGGGSADSEEGERWACNACTFENHPALKKCEMCEMPRMMAGS